MKVLTGGGSVRARALYQSPETLIPTWTFMIDTNVLPAILNPDDPALWTRLAVIKLRHRFVPDPQGEHESACRAELVQEICENESPGILRWLVEGNQRAAAELSSEGALQVPPRMRVWQAE